MDKPNKPPVAVCTVCGFYALGDGYLDRPCSRVYDGKRCQGWMGSAIGTNDWAICPTCNGAGRTASGKCEPCLGTGWTLLRK